MNKQLVLENISKEFVQGDRRIKALEDVTLQVNPGEFAAVVGPSGSGKSTFLSIAGVLLEPTKGTLWINGKSILKWSNKEMTSLRLHEIGFVFQGSNLLPFLTVKEQLLFIGEQADKRKV